MSTRFAAIAKLLEPGMLPDIEREWLLEQSGGPGQRTFGTIHRHQRRDELLRSATEKFWPGQNKSVQARELRRGLALYHETAWRQGDRAVAECPARLLGTKQEMFWQILKAVDAVLAVETIREILRAS